MTETKKNKFNLIAAIIFVVLALIQCYSLTAAIGIYGTFNAYILICLLRIAACILPAVALFTDRRDRTGKVLLLAGFGLLAFLSLYDFFHGFGISSYSVGHSYYSYYTGFHYEYRFNLFCMLPALLEMIGYLCMLAVALCLFTDYIPRFRRRAETFWFLPGIIIAASFILGVFFTLIFAILSSGWSYSVLRTPAAFFGCLLTVAAFLFTAGWMAYPDGFPKRTAAVSGGAGISPGTAGSVSMQESGYIDMLKCVLLLIFTFGIYWLIWIYRTTRYLNRVEGEVPRTPVCQLLLCMFIPFYQIYWVYQSAKRVDRLAVSRGIDSDLTVVCLILAIFVPIIAPMLMQDKINAVAGVESGNIHIRNTVPPASAGVSSGTGSFSASGTSYTAAPPPPQQPAPSPKDYLGVAEELKTYKELLDQGVITQEEFDRKKSQLLNL